MKGGWRAIAGAAALLAAIWFAPLLDARPADADQYLTHLSAVAALDHATPLQVYRAAAARAPVDAAGWFPAAALPLGVWLIDMPYRVAKLLQFLAVVAAAAVFGAVAAALFRSPWLGLLSLVAALCCWQLRAPHDPVAGTSFLLPWFALWLLAAIASWLRYRASGSAVALAGAAASLVVAALISPVAWVVGSVLAALSLFDRGRRIGALALAGVLALTIAAVAMHGRIGAPWERPGYARAVAVQAAAPLPASYRAFGGLHVGNVPALWHGTRQVDDRFIFIPPVDARGWLAAVLAGVLAAAAFVYAPQPAAREIRVAAILGAALWLAPAVVLGSPHQWTHGIPPGQAYDGVFVQYLGAGIVIAAALAALRRNCRGYERFAAALVGVGAFALAIGDVRADAATLALMAHKDEPRGALERAAGAGLFRMLPADAVIAVSRTLPFADGIHANAADARYAIFHYSGRRFTAIDAAAARALDRPGGVWLLESAHRPAGFDVRLARLRALHPFRADKAFAFGVSEGAAHRYLKEKRGLEVAVIAAGGGAIASVTRFCGAVVPEQLFLEQRPAMRWLSGFRPFGPVGYDESVARDGSIDWHGRYDDGGLYPKLIMGRTATLELQATPCPPALLDLVMVAASGAPGTLTIISGAHIDTVPLQQSAAAQFTLRYMTHPGERFRVVFRADAPSGDLDPSTSRYDRDVPRDDRAVLEPVVINEHP